MRRSLFATSAMILLFLVLCSCRIDVNLTGGNDTVHSGSNNWMSRLNGTKLVTEIVLPGTHDTCANYDFMGLSSTAAAQDLTLEEQLNAGVRYVDIRIYNDNGTYKIHHGPQYMHMTLDDVVRTCRTFLQANPSEFLFFTVMGEYKTGREDVTGILESLVSSEPELWVSGTEIGAKTVNDVRGKIIPALRYSDPARTCCLDTSTYYETGARYKTTDPEENLQRTLSAISSCRDGSVPTRPTAIYSACYFEGQFGIPNIRIASSYINPRLQSWLKDYEDSGDHLGMIVTDHMTRDLAYTIYMCNDLD